MNLDNYLGSTKVRKPVKSMALIRRCLYCGLDMENDGSFLYRQSFCSLACKDKYLAEGGI
ncbi:MAG: hypothetical protein Q7S92_04635 [Candidatus Diapherotrites archaeon]|nr:hypothetical protein [Candidatus Diapherotrites archaeon]